MIYTIGHSNYTIEKFLGYLKENNIKVLVDVRSKPFSRHNTHFNRNALREALLEVGIGYKFGGDILGGFNDINVKHEFFIQKMYRIEKLGEEQDVAMMCSEKNPKDCHRAYKLGAYLLRKGLDVMHIHPDGLIDGQMFQDKQKSSWVDYGKVEEQTEMPI